MSRKEPGVGVRRSGVPVPHSVATTRCVPAVSSLLHLKSGGKALHPISPGLTEESVGHDSESTLYGELLYTVLGSYY